MKNTADFTPSALVQVPEQLFYTTDKELVPPTLPEIHIPNELERETDPAIVLSIIHKLLHEQRRLPKWDRETKETDTDHSYAVSMYVSYYLDRHYPDDPELDESEVKNFAEIHDWPEILVGDTVTLGMTEADYQLKQAHEQGAVAALVDLLHRKGLSDYADRIERYEAQSSRSAKFVKAVDKLTPTLVDLSGDGMSAMIEHGVRSVEQLRVAYECDRERFECRFGNDFPELLSEYERVSTKWIRRFNAIRDLGHYSI